MENTPYKSFSDATAAYLIFFKNLDTKLTVQICDSILILLSKHK